MTEIRRLAEQLLEARGQGLVKLPVLQVAREIERVAERWMDPGYDFRTRAVDRMVKASDFPRAMVEWGLDAAFRELLPPSLEELASQELAAFIPNDREKNAGSPPPGRLPSFVTLICGGAIVSPGLWNLCFGLAARAAVLVKCSSADPIFLPLFIESLREEAPEIGRCAAALSWDRAQRAVTAAALDPADLVIAFGNDESIRAIREMSPARAHFIGHGHKVSLAVIGQDAFGREAARGLAEDVAFFDQQGCLSPQVVYLVGDRAACLDFCEELAGAMADLESRFPRRGLLPHEAAAVQQARTSAEVRAAQGLEAQAWQSPGSTAWTLLYDEEPRFEFSCLNRVLRAKRVNHVSAIRTALGPVQGKVQGIAFAPEQMRSELSEVIDFCGTSYLCTPGRLQCPPLDWRDDGVAPMASLVLPGND